MQNLTSLFIFAGAIGRLITLTEGALIRCGSRYERFHQIGAIGFVHCLSQSLQAHKPHSTPGFILKGGKKKAEQCAESFHPPPFPRGGGGWVTALPSGVYTAADCS